jgi:hypothetical protein
VGRLRGPVAQPVDEKFVRWTTVMAIISTCASLVGELSVHSSIIKLLLIITTGVAISGCVSSGRDIDTSQISSFQNGVTTRQQVIAALGPPNTTVVNTNGTVAIGYISVHAHANPAMFIPIVGILATGATAHGQHVIFLFKDDILQSWTTSESDVQSGLGTFDANTQVRSNAAPTPALSTPTPVKAAPIPAPNVETNRRCTKTASGGEWCSTGD